MPDARLDLSSQRIVMGDLYFIYGLSRMADKIRDGPFVKEGYPITQKEVNAVFDEQVKRCAGILQQKTKEYTGDDTDRLGAFKAAAALQHTTPERALAGMLAKHIVSLYDMCFADSVSYEESVRDEKITDSLDYLFLLKAVVKEGNTNKQD